MDSIRSLSDPRIQAFLSSRRNDRIYHPSPSNWEDQVLYFLLPDRFSDGNERGYHSSSSQFESTSQTPLFQPSDAGNAVRNPQDEALWQEAGVRFAGGTITGMRTKLGYLKRLGIGAIWVGPIFKQVAGLETYHGYGVQDFLNIDPRFGTREDLRELVREAHEMGIYVLLDIILNHAGNVWEYQGGAKEYTGEEFPVEGFFDAQRVPNIDMDPDAVAAHLSAYPDGAVWPSELQSKNCFTRKGSIRSDGWDEYPQCVDGDFFDLKDINLGQHQLEGFAPTPALLALVEVYQFWMAYADVDGFRIDTVKHMGDGPTRYFATRIHEFAQSLGKDNFILIGEILGDRVFETVETTGIDAALGVGGIQEQLWKLPRGLVSPKGYFGMFTNSAYMNRGAHAWFRDTIVCMVDDHDQVWNPSQKSRYCCGDGKKTILAAEAMNLCTVGIPCIYYGSEQCFDGTGSDDRYIREAMFGGGFGAFRSRDRHFFNEEFAVYRAIAEIAEIRKTELALRRGRQYLRKISRDGAAFGYPVKYPRGPMRSVVAWSRIFDDVEILCAINTDGDSEQSAWVRVNGGSKPPGVTFEPLYPKGKASLTVEKKAAGAAVQVMVPPGGFCMYKSRQRELTSRDGRKSSRRSRYFCC
ncbi:alpha-amylase [Eremomyces bilateralis CBS 781.70]|uniref:Alpha-amylase n=1 Tax=Eremomyces bilateralis CBS 781.70 TaxID=1392243 RepID=A0A6G1FQH2_9PEZI|nr:alpha-amylase [Eremomyces bilateralis CBS 781.70]KAF1808013.1 alpha-amylase [Eremomyces bilateralis CBS 781.70]